MSEHPKIWFVKDFETGERLTKLVKHTREEAEKVARILFPYRELLIEDSGKRKPPNKCCDDCGGEKPCS